MSADETADLDALQLVCPITAELFEDPVLLVEDGYTYERSAVTAWLEKHDTSPMSGATLATRTLAPNIRARQQADAARGGKPPPEAKRNNEVTRLGKQASVKNDERSRSAAIPGRRRLSPVHLHGSNARSTDTTDTSSNVNTTTTTGVRWSDALLRWVRSYSVSNGGPRRAATHLRLVRFQRKLVPLAPSPSRHAGRVFAHSRAHGDDESVRPEPKMSLIGSTRNRSGGRRVSANSTRCAF